MVQHIHTPMPVFSISEGGLFHCVLRAAGLGNSNAIDLRLRLVCLIAVTYVPLLLLAAAQAVAYNPALKVPFCFDIAESTRFLLVGPLLVTCERLIDPWLGQVVQYMRERLICQQDLPKYNYLIENAVHYQNSIGAEIILLVATFVWQCLEVQFATSISTTWHQLPSNHQPTYAWFWYAYFAKPLIRFLWLRWLWRYLIWAVLLCRVASLNIKVMPTHPDSHGGLLFISVGHARFCALAFIFGVQAASIFGYQIMFEGKNLLSFKYDLITIVVIILVLFLTPLLVFTGKLLDSKRAGMFEYGSLADEYVSQFRSKWIDRADGNESILGTSDIQSLADIGNAYAVVKNMKTCLIEKDIIMRFIVATMLPFTPLILTVYPFDELVQRSLKLIM